MARLIDADALKQEFSDTDWAVNEAVCDLIDAQPTIEIAFLCDRKKECSNRTACGNECKHTTDITHAAGFATFGEVYIELNSNEGRQWQN